MNLDCIHCGLCLSKCPTYQVLGTEPDSPRGRIYLMKAIESGRIAIDDAAMRHLDGCLGCRACESACPSGVRYEHMLVETRARVREVRRPGWSSRLAYSWLLPHPRLIALSFSLLRPLSGMGIVSWFAGNGGARRLFPGLCRAAAKLPRLSRPWKPDSPRFETSREVRDRSSAAFLSGCVMPYLLPQVHRATESVLGHLGCRLEVPPDQACCGALHWHAGDRQGALGLARRNVRAFSGRQSQAVVVNSAGCGAFMKEYGAILAPFPEAAQARSFSAAVQDVCEFVAERIPAMRLRPLAGRVVYDDACHLLHGQGIAEPPRDILRAIPDLQLIEVSHADRCCGAAGDYNLRQPSMADALQSQKTEELLAARPDWIATANPGCILQIAEGMSKAHRDIPAVHPIEILCDALAESNGPGAPRN